MSKEKLAAAKQFIQEKQYREARIILESTDHPKATEWLAKLPKPEKQKNSSLTRLSQNSPIVWIGAVFILFLTFVSGAFFGQVIINYDPPLSQLDLTRTAIHFANETTAALIQGTNDRATENAQQTELAATEQPSDLDLTRTAIAVQNATTETLIQATQTAEAQD